MLHVFLGVHGCDMEVLLQPVASGQLRKSTLSHGSLRMRSEEAANGNAVRHGNPDLQAFESSCVVVQECERKGSGTKPMMAPPSVPHAAHTNA